MASTPQRFFDGLEGAFNADKAAGLSAIYEFDITGEGGGMWTARVSDGTCTVRRGPADAAHPADITIVAGAEDWLSIVDGRLDPQMAFMTGKVKVQGDLSLAMRLRSLFL